METKSTVTTRNFEKEEHSIDNGTNGYSQDARYEEWVWRLLFGASCLSGIKSIRDGKRVK